MVLVRTIIILIAVTSITAACNNGKEVMVVEVGMSWDQADACNSFLTDLISKVKSVSSARGLGAFDNSGKPAIALNAFK